MNRFRAYRDVVVEGTGEEVRVKAITPAEFGALLNSPAFLSIQRKNEESRDAESRGEVFDSNWRERLEQNSAVLLVHACVVETGNGSPVFDSPTAVTEGLSSAQITQLAGVVLELSGVGGGAVAFGDRFRDGVGDPGGD